MSGEKRRLRVAAAQLGPVQIKDERASVVRRMVALLEGAARSGCELVVFPELALTTFFPRYYYENLADVDVFFERAMPNETTLPLFDRAKELGVGFYLGYAELADEGNGVKRYNTSILVDRSGHIVGKYRKIHLPGFAEYRPGKLNQLEKRYFEVGNLGFPVWRTMGGVAGMCICNDRRWPETYRVMGLQGVELLLIGYNTASVNHAADEPAHLRMFHNHLTMQAGAYQNGTWVVASAKAGKEDGHGLIGGSCIIAPTGEIVARTYTEEDDLAIADCDLALCDYIKSTVFDFVRHRRIEHYRLITERTAAIAPD
ncbi:MAG: N-carbamoyl-D-amino-acid hydrolase [Betaproteobacteria bacterium]|nr:N-carbamoyl-D-amino-acid hydrolase [Betaproteobacteria bacterium]MBI3939101.1 N-carbamoyl-D-amino-acid hydrolase [Betaproteobacteria bacterium]